MLALYLVLYGLAFVCFACATFGVKSRVNLIALGLALVSLAWFLQTLEGVI